MIRTRRHHKYESIDKRSHSRKRRSNRVTKFFFFFALFIHPLSIYLALPHLVTLMLSWLRRLGDDPSILSALLIQTSIHASRTVQPAAWNRPACHIEVSRTGLKESRGQDPLLTGAFLVLSLKLQAQVAECKVIRCVSHDHIFSALPVHPVLRIRFPFL